MSSDEDLSFNPYQAIAENTISKAKDSSFSNNGYINTIQRNDILGGGGEANLGPAFEITNIDDLLSIAGIGPLDSAITANFWGVRRGGQNLPQPLPYENTGITFFTKPRLRLTDDNILGNILSLLSDTKTNGMARAIRAFLDPYTGGTQPHTATASKGMNIQVYKSDLVDPLNPFITILGNNVISMTGFPDSDLNTYTSPEGLFHESWSMADDIVTLYGRYDLNCTFRNMYGDPIGTMMYLWLFYMSSVYIGDINPYIDSIIDNEIDYQTRIYRFVLDPTRTRVLRMFCCGAAFPTAANTGANFNYNEGKSLVDESNEYSVNFTCSGAVYYDPRVLKWFNQTVCNFNPNMRNGIREKVYKRIPYENYHDMDNMGYPRIDPNTMDLEWWIQPAVYNELIQRGYNHVKPRL